MLSSAYAREAGGADAPFDARDLLAEQEAGDYAEDDSPLKLGAFAHVYVGGGAASAKGLRRGCSVVG